MMKLSPPLPPSFRSRPAATLALVLSLATIPRAQDAQDAVYLRDGSSEACQVVEENWNGVTIQPERGQKKTLTWDLVRSIEYADMPQELLGGLATLAAGNPESALQQFELAASTPDLRPVVLQQAQFYAAFCQQRLGNAGEAIALYEKVLTGHPKSRYLRMLGENLIDLYLGRKDGAGAQAVVKKLATGASGLDGAEALVQLLEGRILEREGKFAEAQERYAALEAASAAELAQEGKLGRARMLLRQGKGSEAEGLFRALIGESKSPRVQSGAWNGIGEYQSTEGRSKKEAERIQEGLYSFLRTVVQYKPLPGESTEEYERALAGAATCFEYLSQLEPNADKKKLWRERQRERLEQLQQEYPSSSFLKKS